MFYLTLTHFKLVVIYLFSPNEFHYSMVMVMLLYYLEFKSKNSLILFLYIALLKSMITHCFFVLGFLNLSLKFEVVFELIINLIDLFILILFF